ncbi:MAG: LysM peptidoglycan-binding domain-containing protein [Fodinibius sp.]|nr:LysM peptidoglycan-binding domain-containing protein [Fodinibius sp.]
MMNTVIKTGIAIGVLLLCISFSAAAQSTTHTVKKSETLFSIAQKYDIEVSQLKTWNDLDNNNLEVGQSLIVGKGSKSPDEGITHTVEAEETLFSISKQYNVRIAEIKSWNNLNNNNVTVGQNLKIYPNHTDSESQQSVVMDKETQQNAYYVVKSGDSLYKIAQTHGMTVNELKELNDLSSNTIRVGQRLTVHSNEAPPSVAKSMESSPQGKFIQHEISGQSISLQNLLDKFKMSEAEFRALNPGTNENTFQPGRKLTMLAPPNRQYENPYLKDANLQDLGNTPVTKYSNSEKAQPTTNGELYNPEALTAAHSNISLGSVIYIQNPENEQGVYIRINDRNSGAGLKLSAAAWQTLNFNSSSPTVTIYQNQ